jgi:SAM-dependent MidA family methyltransferase
MTTRGPASTLIETEIRSRGPIPVARFLELALYAPGVGYYMTARQRSGRAGDFHTSVDVGPLFGALLARLASVAWSALGKPPRFDIVEHAAGNGRLMRDVLDALAKQAPDAYEAIRVRLVERSPEAGVQQPATLGRHAARLESDELLRRGVRGVIFANELLDALPFHRVLATEKGPLEVYVDVEAGGFVLRTGPLSTPRLDRYFHDTRCHPSPGGVADVSLAALDWCERAASSLREGYLMLIDYGRDAARLYGGCQAGTLRAFGRHLVDPPRAGGGPLPVASWLRQPGGQDVTAHVDWTAVEAGLRRAGLVRHAFTTQMRFLQELGVTELIPAGPSLTAVRERLAATALLSPEGLGESHQVLVMGTADAPRLRFAWA